MNETACLTSLRTEEKMERNYGIDILRAISMLMVCILHVLLHGGILNKVTFQTGQYNVAWFLEILCYAAVNCYALISGFVGVRAKFKLSNLAYLWIQVAFCNGIIALGFDLIQGTFSPKTLLEFFPVYMNRYWYFTAYFGLFFLMPILNAAIHSVNKRTFKICLLCLFISFSVVGNYKDLFQLNSGYSLLWLAYLYLVGGYVFKYKPCAKIKTYWLILFACGCILSVWLLKVWKNRDFFGYLSPAHVLFAIVLLELFSRVKVKTKGERIVVSFSASTSFGVYILHTQKNIWQYLIFEKYAGFNPFLLAFAVVGTALAIYLLCSALDYLRLLLFKLFHVKPLLQKIESKIINKFQRGSHVSE